MTKTLDELRNLKQKMLEAEEMAFYWLADEHLDLEKSKAYEKESDRLYAIVWEMERELEQQRA